MREAWFVFFGPDNEELAAVTVRGLGDSEINATIELLAYEREIDPGMIGYRVAMR